MIKFLKSMGLIRFVWENVLNTQFFTAVIALIAVAVAYQIGVKQNEINRQIGNLQDSVELYASAALSVNQNEKGETISLTPYILIQNVGTRLVYFDKYNFNGRIYEVGGQVRPSTYSQAQNNFYRIELPTNGESHVSLYVDFTDIDGRKWRSQIIADRRTGVEWDVKTYHREEISR